MSSAPDQPDDGVHHYEPLIHPDDAPPMPEQHPSRKRPYTSLENAAIPHVPVLSQTQPNEGWLAEGSIAVSPAPHDPMEVIDGFLEAQYPGQQLDGEFMDYYGAPDEYPFDQSNVQPHHDVYYAMMEAPASFDDALDAAMDDDPNRSDLVNDAFALINQAPNHSISVSAPFDPHAARPTTFPHGVLAPLRLKRGQHFVATFHSAEEADQHIRDERVVPGKKPKPTPRCNKRNYVCCIKDCHYQVQCFDDGKTFNVYATGVHTCARLPETTGTPPLDDKLAETRGAQISEAGKTSTTAPRTTNITYGIMASGGPPQPINNNSTATASERKWHVVGRFTNSKEMVLAWKAYGVLPTVRTETNDRGVEIKHYKCPSCPYQMMTKARGKQFALYGLGPHDVTQHEQNELPKRARSKAPSPATPFHDQSAAHAGRRSESMFDAYTGTNSTSSPIVDSGEVDFRAPTLENDNGVPMARPTDGVSMAQVVKEEPADGVLIAQSNDVVPMAQPKVEVPIPMQLANNSQPRNDIAASSVPVNFPIEDHGATNPAVPMSIQIHVKAEPREEVDEQPRPVTPEPINNVAVVSNVFNEAIKYGPLSVVHTSNLMMLAYELKLNFRLDDENTGAFSFYKGNRLLTFRIKTNNSLRIKFYRDNQYLDCETLPPNVWPYVVIQIKDRCVRTFGLFPRIYI